MEATFVAFWAPALWCAVGVPLAFGCFIHAYLRLRQPHQAAVTNSPPRHGMVVLPMLLLLVASGVACLWWLLEVDTFLKSAFSATYGVAMAIGLVLIAAHASGDM